MYFPEQLGQNIRHYRKSAGLTQAALAERLYVSAQNVFKWENGLSCPGVEHLCLLAEVLRTNVDRLLGNEKQRHEKLMIGIDGGGTKTEFCLFDERGHVLAHERLGCTNPNVCGIDGALSTLKKGIDALMAQEGSICAIFAGIAGCGVESNHRAVEK